MNISMQEMHHPLDIDSNVILEFYPSSFAEDGVPRMESRVTGDIRYAYGESTIDDRKAIFAEMKAEGFLTDAFHDGSLHELWDGGTLIGLASFVIKRTKYQAAWAYNLELRHIYLLRKYRHQGLGSDLACSIAYRIGGALYPEFEAASAAGIKRVSISLYAEAVTVPGYEVSKHFALEENVYDEPREDFGIDVHLEDDICYCP